MAQEIEKKFLVNSDEYKSLAVTSTRITQGYLSSVPERTVRIRTKGDKGYITIKGESNASGAERFEWEKEIPLSDARDLLKLCEPGIIDKIRYEVVSGKHTIEVDEFLGENLGLIMAEIELSSENEAFQKFPWMELEVTGDIRYYNAMLTKHPFTTW
jgi:adenylate cyclase